MTTTFNLQLGGTFSHSDLGEARSIVGIQVCVSYSWHTGKLTWYMVHDMYMYEPCMLHVTCYMCRFPAAPIPSRCVHADDIW